MFKFMEITSRAGLLVLCLLLVTSCSDFSGRYSDGSHPAEEWDLLAKSIDSSTSSINALTLDAGGTVNVTVGNNSGFTVHRRYLVTVFEDTDLDRSYNSDHDNILGSSYVDEEHPDGEDIIVTININGHVLFLDNIIYACVEPGDNATDTNTDNNIIHDRSGVAYTQPAGTIDPVIEWQWTTGSLLPDSKHVMCAPVVINLTDDNGDGVIDSNDIPDIVFHTFTENRYTQDGILRAISGDGSGEIFTVTGYQVSPGANPAAGDIDGDGLPEILTLEENVSGQCRVLAFENNGNHKWSSVVGVPHYLTSIYLADIDMDGSVEIIAGSLVLNNNGSTKWIGAAGSGRYNAVAANIDMQGDMEVVGGNTAYRSNGSIYWQNTSVLDGYPGIGDFDEDDYPEIVVVSRSGADAVIYMLEHDGQLKWGPLSFTTTATSYNGGGSAPSVADIDNDGQADILFSTTDRLIALEADGTVKWSKAINDPSSGVTGVSIFDLDGDGIKEVIFADQYNLQIFSGDNGDLLWTLQVGNGTLAEIPVIADVDNDNQAEIILAANNYWNAAYTNGVIVFGSSDKSWFNTRKIWNQYGYHVTNINDDFSIPRVEVNSWTGGNTYRSNQLIHDTGCYDISASYARVDTSGFPGFVTVTVRIGNGGLVPVSSINIALYDGNPASGGTFISRKNITGSLASGTFNDVTFTWASPVSGSRSLYVVADDDGYGRSKLREIDEINNTARIDCVIE